MKKFKIAIGCLVQWYEIGIISEYVESLKQATEHYSKIFDGEIYIDFLITGNEDLEESIVPTSDLTSKIGSIILSKIDRQENMNIRYNFDTLISIADYRREFNEGYCNQVDVLVWGESDMLIPKEMFTTIHQLHNSRPQLSNKYIMTFASCKMWDESWKHLEHPEFTDKPFIEGDKENWWSLRYTMSLEEMNAINDRAEDLSIKILPILKFNGCGLVISSEVIKSGVNIPLSIFFVHEDTAFMRVCRKLLPNLSQVHISNILLVHNRKHPRKRSHIKGEELIEDTSEVGKMRNTHSWYSLANKMSEENCNNLFSIGETKFNTWEDVWSRLKNDNK
jgi:hypothetical protein